VLIVLTGVFGFGIALLLAVLDVYVRDTSRLVPHFLRLWLYLSPAIWVYTRLDSHGVIGTIAKFNPMYWGMTAWTMAFGGSLNPEGPTFGMAMLIFTSCAALTLLIGFFTFVSREDEFAIRN
jgi:teichoic acid transport system permease protein